MRLTHAHIRLFNQRRPRLSRLLQVAALIVLCLAGNGASRLWQLPVPGSVLALGVVLLLLATRVLPAAALRHGADWLLAEMLLFFIPAVMAVSQHMTLLQRAGVRIMAVVLVGTVLVMAVTAFMVDRVWQWEQRRAR